MGNYNNLVYNLQDKESHCFQLWEYVKNTLRMVNKKWICPYVIVCITYGIIAYFAWTKYLGYEKQEVEVLDICNTSQEVVQIYSGGTIQPETRSYTEMTYRMQNGDTWIEQIYELPEISDTDTTIWNLPKAKILRIPYLIWVLSTTFLGVFGFMLLTGWIFIFLKDENERESRNLDSTGI